MKNEFVAYEQALALKELGFNEPCFGYYYTLNGKDWKFAEKSEYYRLDDEINIGGKFSLLAPLYQQAFRWFRENHDKYGVVNIDLSNNLKDKIFVYMVEDKLGYIIDRSEEYNTYEEAELACLEKLIEIAHPNK
jgi:hypothetical protein